MTRLESLPPPLQRAVAARDRGVEPFSPAIETLDVSWEIVQGNIGELFATIGLFDTDDQGKATALWQQDPAANHRFHLDIVRRFHNVLSAALAHVEHSRRAAALFKRLAPDSFQAYEDRQAGLDHRLGFAVTIRDFSIHAGVHASVLTLQATDAGTFQGRVGFDVKPILAEQERKRLAGRNRGEKEAAAIAIEHLTAAGSTIEIRALVAEFYSHILDQRQWLRAELINVHERLSNDLARWATEEDRAAVIQYFIDHPIPVYRAGAS